MKGLAGVLLLVALSALRGIAVASVATTPQADWAPSAIRTLAADGVIDGYPPGALSRAQIALLTARAIAKVEVSGASKQDEARVQALSDAFRPELDALGVRDPNLSAARASLNQRTHAAQNLGISGEFAAGTDRALGGTVDLRIPQSAHLENLTFEAGTLQNLPSSVAGLAFSTRTALQPSLHGVAFSGTANGLSDFYFSVSRMDRDLYYNAPLAPGPSNGATGSFLFPVSPQTGGYIAFGARDLVTGRFTQHLRSLPDAAIGVTYNHVFDAGPSGANALVSNTVFGMDVSMPLLARSGWRPAVYAEAATSSATTTSTVLFAPATRLDNALVAGIKFQVRTFSGSIQYQAIGANFVNGAPATPGFFGLSPVIANAQLSSSPNPAFTQINAPTPLNYPTFNPFEDTPPGSLSAYVPNTQGVKVDLSTPVRVGAYTVRGNFSAAHLQELSPNAFGSTSTTRGTDEQFTAGTSFDVRALGRPVALDVSASYEHLLRNDSTAAAYVPYNASAQGPDPGAFVTAPAGLSPVTFNPNLVDVTRRSLNAAAAVPLSRDLRLNLQYNAQYYTGSYSAVGQSIDGRNDFYLGNLTYQIPRTASAITFSAKQYRYRDSLLPANALTQNRADLNFTVKF